MKIFSGVVFFLFFPFMSVFFPYPFKYFFISPGSMWNSALTAVLNSFYHPEVPSAFVSQEVKGTVAEKTVEFFFPYTLVTGKVLAAPVRIKFMTVFHCYPFPFIYFICYYV